MALQAFLHEQEHEDGVVAVRLKGRNGNFESTNLGTRPGFVSFFRKLGSQREEVQGKTAQQTLRADVCDVNSCWIDRERSA